MLAVSASRQYLFISLIVLPIWLWYQLVADTKALSIIILMIFMWYWRAVDTVQIHRVWSIDLYFISRWCNSVGGFELLKPVFASSFDGSMPPISGLSQQFLYFCSQVEFLLSNF